MFPWRRRNDGFKWVSYVPTQLRLRRQARRQKITDTRIKVQGAAVYHAKRGGSRAIEGISAAIAWLGAGIAAAALGTKNWLANTLGPAFARALSPVGQALARSASALWRLLSSDGIQRYLGLIGALCLIGGAFRVLSTGMQKESAIALSVGTLLLLLAALPLIARLAGPPVAKLALSWLQARKKIATTRTGRAAGNLVGKLRPLANLLAGAAVIGFTAAGGVWAYNKLATPPPVVSGSATVNSADVLQFGTSEVRLAGVAAADAGQLCGEGTRRWRCRDAAQRALATLVQGKLVTCQPMGRDESGRPIATCRKGQQDVAAQLVRDGYLFTDRSDSAGYRRFEDEARAAKRGMWRGAVEPPWMWQVTRDKLWEAAKRQSPEGCPIKAEQSGRGKIYHLPWSPTYERVQMPAKARGKRWFCSEQEAIAAGYRLPDRS